MKRSDFFIKLTTAVLFVAVVSYVGIYIYNAAHNTFVTTVAISYTIEDTLPSAGFIVRSESVLTDVGDAVLQIVGEGERVSSGQAVAVEYLTREALETASEIQSLRLRIAQLMEPVSGGAVESASFASIMELSKAVQRGDLSRLDELSLRVETHIFVGGAAEIAELPNLQARLGLLEGRSAGVRTIHAPFSGFFSQTVDGYEHIRPDMLSGISPSDLTELFRIPSGIHGACKLVTGVKWYYAAIMDAADASRLPVGQSISLQFSGAYQAVVDMQVESVSRREDDRSAVLFSSDRGVHNITMLRHLSAEVLFDSVSGLRVPKEAIHLDEEGITFVFIQTGVRAERVDVEILLESGDSYLVRDGAETGSPLRVGSTIIVRGNNLLDGRVVA